MLPQLLYPQAPPVASEVERERGFFPFRGTFMDETAAGFVPVQGMPHDVDCQVQPYSQGQTVGPYETGRRYTNRIRLMGYFPRANNSMVFEVTDTTGEQVMYSIHDVEHSVELNRTALLCQRRGLDS